MAALMEGESSWDSYPVSHFGREIVAYDPVPEGNISGDGGVVSLDSFLPDDILEMILSFLPIASIIRAASVCKRWYKITHSRKFLCANDVSQKPWYFMFTCNDNSPAGFAYDPTFRKWYNLFLPCLEKRSWLIASSFGLVCFMDNDSRNRVFVCNPITRSWKRILDPPVVNRLDYITLALSVNRRSHNYTVVMAKSKQVLNDFHKCELSIHIYESESRSWSTPIREVLTGWSGGDVSVICGGVWYCLIHSLGLGNSNIRRHGLIMYNLSSRSHTSLIRTVIPVPCSLTCGRIMNLNDRLVMVGGTAKYGRPDIIKGIRIWELHKKRWREIARMPHRLFQGFGEFDEVFVCSGADDFIYIQTYGFPTLLVFDMNQKQWMWSMKCPVTKRSSLQVFTGFCFKPRLEVES